MNNKAIERIISNFCEHCGINDANNVLLALSNILSEILSDEYGYDIDVNFDENNQVHINSYIRRHYECFLKQFRVSPNTIKKRHLKKAFTQFQYELDIMYGKEMLMKYAHLKSGVVRGRVKTYSTVSNSYTIGIDDVDLLGRCTLRDMPVKERLDAMNNVQYYYVKDVAMENNNGILRPIVHLSRNALNLPAELLRLFSNRDMKLKTKVRKAGVISRISSDKRIDKSVIAMVSSELGEFVKIEKVKS